MTSISVSAVVPTRNRPESLLRTLRALIAQSYALKEIVIVDSSDEPCDLSHVRPPQSTVLSHVTSIASVCAQRNIGIRRSSGEYVFLIDDDIEPPRDYVEKLVGHIEATGAGAVSGLWLQRGSDGAWTHHYPVSSFRRLLWCYVFQLSVWGELQCHVRGRPLRWLNDFVAGRFRLAGNTLSKAGWPLVTDFEGDVVATRIYSLGASIIKRAWLESAPFDETLDPHGIGDNYGVAITFPERLHVVKATFIHHHLEPRNRLAAELASFRRILALHYFLSLHSTLMTRLFFLWSLIGMGLAGSLYDRRRARMVLRALSLIVSRRNPYLRARAKGLKYVQPDL